MEFKAHARVSVTASKPLEGFREYVPRLVEEMNTRIRDGNVESVEVSGHLVTAELETWGSISESVMSVLECVEELLEEAEAEPVHVEVEELRATIRFDEAMPPNLPSRVCSIPEVLNASLRDGRVLRVLLKPMTVEEVETGLPDRVVAIIKSSTKRLVRQPSRGRRSRMKRTPFVDDPTMVAVELGWVKELPAEGFWLYTPPYVGLLTTLGNMFVEEFEKLGFQPILAPTFIPEGLAGRFSGDRPCVGVWMLLEEQLYSPRSLPLKLYQPPRWVPNPRKNSRSLKNPSEVYVLDAAFLGTEEQVSNLGDELLEALLELVDVELDLEWRVPDDPSSRRVEVYLPYTGPRDRAEWLPVVETHRLDAGVAEEFNIRVEECREIWTGCVRVDLTALAFGFLSQRGFDVDGWPDEVKRRFKKEYKVPRSLLWPPGG